MIDRRAARLIVEREMNLSYDRHGKPRDERLRVFDEFTRESRSCWVIYFGDSLADVVERRTGIESRYPPCLVGHKSGDLFSTGKSWPLEKYIGDFEMQLLAQS